MAKSSHVLLSAIALLAARVSAQRALHWVIRVSDLSATLNFTHHVLGMLSLIHI